MRREMMLRKSLESYILICSMFGVIQKKEHFNEDSYEACGNSIPVEKVVYNVLSHLEKLPDPSFLWVLFNRVNLKEYPALREIYKSLETELQDRYSPQRRKQEEQKLATMQPSYEQGTNLHTHENWATENLQEPETPQNQVDEIIAISSESSECSEEK
ncbi:nuclear autoantigen Sp-100 isoform X5 [Rattus norvegicus]|nr:nuclear autoantigen Sp-100 isoform X6 [Rattus norvegicus]